LRPRGRVLDRALHAARARAQRRRRLGRVARSRLRRVLRDRRVCIRAARLAALRHPSAGLRVGAGGRGDRRHRRPAARAAVVAAHGRLPGDRDALLPAALPDDHDELAERDRRAVRDPEHRSVRRVRRERPAGARRRVRGRVPVHRAWLLRGRLRRAPVPEPLADRQGVEVASRGPARSRGDGHARQPPQAAQLLVRGRGRSADRDALRGAVRERVPADVLLRAADHRLHDGDPRRLGKPGRGRRGRGDHLAAPRDAARRVEVACPVLPRARRLPGRAPPALARDGGDGAFDARLRLRGACGVRRSALELDRGRACGRSRWLRRALGRRPGAPRAVDHARLVHRRDRGGARLHDAERESAPRRARADAVPRSLRVGERDALEAGARPLHRARRDPDRSDDPAPQRPPGRTKSGDHLMPLLELQGVSLSFGGLKVVDELDLHVDEGEIVSVIGPNGAGKTTLFNLITGIYRPESGRILLDGESIVGLEPHQISRRGISRTFQTLRLFLNMSVKENVMAAAYGHTRAGVFRSMLRTPGMRREEREIEALAEERLRFFGDRLLGYRWNQPAYSLSYANRRRLEIARATATRPRLLLLDEPAAGMNPAETHEITELIGQLRTEGGYTILVIEHDMHVVEGISDRVVALDHGVKIAEGSFETVATNEKVVEAYLGLNTMSKK